MAKEAPNRDDDVTDQFDEDDLLELYEGIEKGFEAQRDRTNWIKDNWELYNCKLSDKQFYNGTSQISLPFLHDAVEARVTRFVNQIFPNNGHFVEIITFEVDLPLHFQALIEDYVRKSKLRTKVVPALLRNGDLEGTYVLSLSWRSNKRMVVTRRKTSPTTDGMENEAAEPVEDFVEEEIIDSFPDVEVISDPDFLVQPPTGNSIEDTLEDGGSVTIMRRWSRGKIKKMMRDGDIEEDVGEDILEEMSAQRSAKDNDMAKENLESAGVKERGKVFLAYETWKKIIPEGSNSEEPLLHRIYFGGEDRILGVKRNPYWNDRCPILAIPVKKIAGAMKSVPLANMVTDLQIFANDTINEAADTAHYSAMPIVMTDPLKNPRAETMMLDIGAVWETSPNDTSVVAFPQLWKDGMDRALAVKDQIFQTLTVNPAMVPQSTGGAKKRNQAELAIEQQVDILTTADTVDNLEEGVLTPLAQWFVEMDHQFRDKKTTIKRYGEAGMEANMEDVEPIQLNERFYIRWLGVEQARNAATMQQQISWINVIKGIPPQLYKGYDLNLAPVLIRGTENVFDTRIAPEIFKKQSPITVDPMVENDMLLEGFPVHVHPLDDDMEHLKVHMLLKQAQGHPPGVDEHMLMHQQQMLGKAQQQVQSSAPGGGGGGGPRPGAQAAAPRGGQQPPGAVHKDQMAKAGAVTPPRKPS